jgi:hypothetical protein
LIGGAEATGHEAETKFQKKTPQHQIGPTFARLGTRDGRLSGREVLLAMYIPRAHHPEQAEIYLRDKASRPPSYKI